MVTLRATPRPGAAPVASSRFLTPAGGLRSPHRVGRRSRRWRCSADVVACAEPGRGASVATVLDPPLRVVEPVTPP
ncbi:MAG: acyl-CoA hydrolase [Modestobacter sp.]|nr:acyl-CoA hydrolase [Modestobacter sp.]